MDSMQLYLSIYQNAKFEYNRNNLKKVDEIVEHIIAEIMAEPCDMNKSSFLRETVKLIKIVRNGEYSLGMRVLICPYDAYVIVKALQDRINNPKFRCTLSMEYSVYSNGLFESMWFKGSQQQEMNEVNRILKEIQSGLQEKTEKAVKSEQPPQMEASLRLSNEKSLERSNNCKLNVQQWHSENTGIIQKISEMQPMVGEMLQKMMQFSDEITESYVLQFARMQIELYNLISDNLSYHASVVNKSNNQDYYNAVLNYKDFLDMIIDNLSAFGVEEISSRIGDRFDGSLHEVLDNANFSPRWSSVKESVRSGFKYKDIVIQKERIRV